MRGSFSPVSLRMRFIHILLCPRFYYHYVSVSIAVCSESGSGISEDNFIWLWVIQYWHLPGPRQWSKCITPGTIMYMLAAIYSCAKKIFFLRLHVLTISLRFQYGWWDEKKFMLKLHAEVDKVTMWVDYAQYDQECINNCSAASTVSLCSSIFMWKHPSS